MARRYVSNEGESWQTVIAKNFIGGMIAVLAFLAHPTGPLGEFWPPAHGMAMTDRFQLPSFILLNIFEAVSIAVAIVLLVTEFPNKAYRQLTLRETQVAFLCLIFFLGNWWVHDSLHLHVGQNLTGLLFIEYGFHATIMVAAGYLLTLAGKLYRTKT